MKSIKDWKIIIEDEMKHIILPGTIEAVASHCEREVKQESNGWKYIATWNGRMLIKAYREIARLNNIIEQSTKHHTNIGCDYD
jgi:hypothetical protein